jgi:hypothetical protein
MPLRRSGPCLYRRDRSTGLDPLIGTWQAPTARVQPRGSLNRILVITTDGRSENHSVMRGLYEGQTPGDLAMESVLYGRIVVRGSYFLFNPDSLVTHDLFYGPMDRSVERDFSGWPRDSTHFAIQGNNLVLEYYSYPADAPVLTEQTYTRVR